MQYCDMSAGGDDERLMGGLALHQLVEDLDYYRCSACNLVHVVWPQQAGARAPAGRHVLCGGQWQQVKIPLHRALLKHFLTRQMLGGTPQRRE